jgi:Ser/Thr protein kinase RdoA (MazF antagonist)
MQLAALRADGRRWHAASLARGLASVDIPRMSPSDRAAPGAAFVEGLVRAWPRLSNPVIEPLSGGLIHQTWQVSDPAGEFILQRVSDVFSPAVHENVATVTAHLSRHGVPTFELQRTAEGGLLWREAGADHRLMTRLPGRAFEICGGPAPARSAARAVARFHSALADFAAPLAGLGFAFCEPERSHAALDRALVEYRAHPLHGEVAQLAARIARARSRQADAGALPVRVIHGDLKFSNVLFCEVPGVALPGEAHALIDLDTVLRRPLHHDLGDAWRSWCNRRPEDDPEADLDLGVFAAVGEGYLEALGFELEPAEHASLADALERVALELAARFATDALEERWWSFDATRYARSGLHQLDRARGQLSLHDQARDARRAIRESLGLG